MLNDFLIRKIIPSHDRPDDPQVRLRYGMFCGYAGLAVNVVLFLLKFTVGLLSGSIAITADAVNNLSDAGSSMVTVFGFKISAAPADQDHPFGHGRIEYVAGVIVSVIIIAAGLNFLKESILHIVHPGKVQLGPILLALVAGSVLLKVWLFVLYRRVGTRIASQTVRAAAFDSLSDIVCTAVVLLAAVADGWTSFPVDGCAGLLAAVFVLVGGGKVLHETVDPLLGEAPSPELVQELRSRLLHVPGILGVHDIIVHNYGPNRYFATAHAEVDLESDILTVHDLLESAEKEIAAQMPVRLVLHCDPRNAADPRIRQWRERVNGELAKLDPGLKAYDFRIRDGASGPELSFDVLVPRAVSAGAEELRTKLTEAFRQYPGAPELRISVFTSFV